VSYYFGWGNRVQYSVLGTDGRIRRTVDVEVAGSPMMHDFSLTDRHVVIYDLPVTFDIDTAMGTVPSLFARPARWVASQFIGRRRIPERVSGLMLRLGGSDSQFPYSWNASYPARVGVMARDGDGSDIRWFDVEPCYVYHPLNAYEDGDRVVLDVVRHPKMFLTDRHGPNEGAPTLDRWTVDLSAGKVLEERLDDRGQEFPRVDERLVGRPHRYGYTVGFTPNSAGDVDHASQLLKHDLAAGQTQVRTFGANRGAGEFVFVPERPDASEDEGIVMGFVYDGDSDRSDLVLLDAGTLDTVAEIHLPVRVPYGFHGSWVPASA
jgi:carotenoid cleavage dioxygenase